MDTGNMRRDEGIQPCKRNTDPSTTTPIYLIANDGGPWCHSHSAYDSFEDEYASG